MSSVQRKKVAVVNKSLYHNPLVLLSLDAILAALKGSSALPSSFTGSLTRDNLASCIFRFQDELERLCGRDSPEPRPITKFPSSMFDDKTLGGSLHHLLLALCEEAVRRGATCVEDIMQLNESDRNRDLLKAVDRSLRESAIGNEHRYPVPRIFFNRVPVALINKLSKLVIDHGGAVVSSEDAATHIVDWNEDVDGGVGANENPDDPTVASDDYIRILEVQKKSKIDWSLRSGTSSSASSATAAHNGTEPAAAAGATKGGSSDADSISALVHWWYYPDSYNEWLPAAEIDANDPPDLATLHPATRSKWYVCCRFILDCAIFNEWGNPLDYENENEYSASADEGMDVVGEEQPTPSSSSSGNKKSRGKKRYSHLVAAAKQKQQQLQQAAVVTGTVLGGVGGTEKLLPDALPPSLTGSGAGGFALDVNSRAGSGGGTATLVKVEQLGDNSAGMKRKEAPSTSTSDAVEEEVGKGAKAEAREEEGGSNLPDWFQRDAVSSYERMMLGGCGILDERAITTDGSATNEDDVSLAPTSSSAASEYLKIRHALMTLCAQSPMLFVTATEARRKLPGDVSKILKIHEFLSGSGVINQQVRQEARTDPLYASLSLSATATAVTATTKTIDAGAATGNDASPTQSWGDADDAVLMTLIAEQQPASVVQVDWGAVAQSGKDRWKGKKQRTAVDCAEHFVELNLDPHVDAAVVHDRRSKELQNENAAVPASAAALSLLAAIKTLRKTAPLLSTDVGDVVNAGVYVLQDEVSKRLHSIDESLVGLSQAYLQTKLKILTEKVTLLERVEESVENEGLRLEAEKKDLQILRAQLSLAQQQQQLHNDDVVQSLDTNVMM
mmetsp:Transcript_17048/g.28600  ORF Transcript_17048/g.28600 Transcript_17048/m.28600 type:complete len:843 (-) Transcript_17048:77-2605(-)